MLGTIKNSTCLLYLLNLDFNTAEVEYFMSMWLWLRPETEISTDCLELYIQMKFLNV